MAATDDTSPLQLAAMLLLLLLLLDTAAAPTRNQYVTQTSASARTFLSRRLNKPFSLKVNDASGKCFYVFRNRYTDN